MASSSKPCATTAAVLLLLLALAAATAADAAKRRSMASSPIFPRLSGPIFPGPRPEEEEAKDIIASVPLAAPGPEEEEGKDDMIASEPNADPRLEEEADVSATCMGSLLDLSPCLAFFRDAGSSSAPAGCCQGLRAIVGAQPACLCHIVNHTLERAIGVDIPVDRALSLIGDLCGLSLPEDLMTGCADGGDVPPLYMCPAPSA